jgi:hypothetical protein
MISAVTLGFLSNPNMLLAIFVSASVAVIIVAAPLFHPIMNTGGGKEIINLSTKHIPPQLLLTV